MTRARSWSLSARMTRWILVTTTTLVAGFVLLGAWFVDGAIEREVESLVDEELHEMGVRLELSPDSTPDELAAFADQLRREHPANPMAFRIRDGDAVLLDEEADWPGGVSASGRHRSASGHELALTMDVAQQRSRLALYWEVAGGFALMAALFAIGTGLLLQRAVVGELRAISERLRRGESDVAGDPGALPAEIRDVAEALAGLLRRIEEQSERAELLTAGTAHELRSPIQNLLGETELALLRERDAEEYRRVLRSHHEELRRLVRAVDNLVTLCSARQRSTGIPRERFDLEREADPRLGPEHAEAARRDVELAVHSEGDLMVEGDREAIVLVLRNLVGNAIQWTPEGTRVEVRLRGDADSVRIVVDDAGPGVPEGDRERIFEPLQRGRSREGSRDGYGLGLALTRTAVHAHGGTISVGTSPAGGARFEVALPRARSTGAPQSAASSKSSNSKPGATTQPTSA